MRRCPSFETDEFRIIVASGKGGYQIAEVPREGCTSVTSFWLFT
jgi:hypothetical protein